MAVRCAPIHDDCVVPPSSLIGNESLECIKSIGEGTVGSLRGLVSSVEHLGKTLYDEFGERFEQ